MDVSIIISTRDRADSLRAALEHVGAVDIPDGWSAELIVVDNGSSDHTRQVVEDFRPGNLEVRYVFEGKRGKANASNAGLAAARGKVLVLTDDDVHVPTTWVRDMCEPILSGRADAVQGAIRIAPHLDRPWLKGVLRVWVAGIEYPDKPPPGLVGANCSVSKAAVDAVGPFDPRLGPGAAGFYEDTVLGWNLERQGYRILYRRDVVVEHNFDGDRLTLPAFMDLARRMARSTAIVKPDARLFGVRPNLLSLLRLAPRLAYHAGVQGVRLLVDRQPWPGFLSNYFRYRLWLELRKDLSGAAPGP